MKLILLFTTLLFLNISNITSVDASYTSGAGTKVKASIPSKVDIRVFGYTAPYTIVQATSVRVFAQVSSDKTGYFLIDPLPVSVEAKELCLTTIDSQKRSGFPLCIQLPEIDKPTEIGPLLLSPTISLSANSFIQSASEQSSAEGVTLPNAEVEIAFFESGSQKSAKNILIPQVEAKTIAKITTKTDKSGSFSINLPTNKPIAFRLFARSFYEKAPTPKSQTLTYSVISYTNWWLANILPKLILLMFSAVAAAIALWYEIKTGKGRRYLLYFSETRLKPFGVKTRLKLRRIWYNFRGIWRSHQI